MIAVSQPAVGRRSRRIPLFIASRFLSALSEQMIIFAVPLIAYRLTHSLAVSGFTYFLEWIPRLISLPFSGIICDKFGGRRLYLVSDLSRVLLCGLLFLVAVHAQPWHVYFLALLSGAVGFFYEMAFVALESTVPTMVSTEEIPKTQSVLQAVDQMAQLLGPVLAAAVSYVLSIPALFLLIAGLLLISAINVLYALPATGPVIEQKLGVKHMVKEFYQGLHLVINVPELRLTTALTILVNIMFGSIFSTSAGYIQEAFRRTETDYGKLNSIAGGFGVLVFLAIPFLLKKVPIERLGVSAFVSICVTILAIATTTQYWIFVAAYALLWAGDGVINVYIRSTRVQYIPPERLGATLGVIVLLNLSGLPLSGLLVSSLQKEIGVPGVLAVVLVFSGVAGTFIIRSLTNLPRQPVSASPVSTGS